MSVPCGHCVNCKIAHSREWATRIIHEMDNHKASSFVTLTYDDDHLPENKSISKNELQKFFKRLRKKLNTPIKYFACGEYGENFERPHYHAIILGLNIREKNLVQEAWGKGFVKIGTVTYDSARYTADYVMKKQNKNNYQNIEQPFQLSSLGIGKTFALKNAEQIKQEFEITLNGQKVGLPKYYKKVLALETEELAVSAAEYKQSLYDHYKKRVKDDEKIKPALTIARRQSNANAIARLAIKRDRKI